ncbi:MAG: hypothetical protein M1820_004234 [Bogoriella megaspora]|nr:MAG: hypothetical protein M1820_004234 [Bogoriella megaspora]
MATLSIEEEDRYLFAISRGADDAKDKLISALDAELQQTRSALQQAKKKIEELKSAKARSRDILILTDCGSDPLFCGNPKARTHQSGVKAGSTLLDELRSRGINPDEFDITVRVLVDEDSKDSKVGHALSGLTNRFNPSKVFWDGFRKGAWPDVEKGQEPRSKYSEFAKKDGKLYCKHLSAVLKDSLPTYSDKKKGSAGATATKLCFLMGHYLHESNCNKILVRCPATIYEHVRCAHDVADTPGWEWFEVEEAKSKEET